MTRLEAWGWGLLGGKEPLEVQVQLAVLAPLGTLEVQAQLAAWEQLWALTLTLALALTFEPSEAGVMQRLPRDTKAPILSRFMTWRIVFVSLLMVAGTFGLFLYEISLGASTEYARTVAVNTLVMLEVAYLLNTRYLHETVLSREGLLGNRYVLMAIGLVIVFQMAFTYIPLMQTFFRVEAIDGASWLRIIGAAVLLFLLVEVEKKVMRPPQTPVEPVPSMPESARVDH